MKKSIGIVFLLFVFNLVNAQDENSPAVKLAHHIENKLADSLNLSNQQKAKIFAINMELYKQKTAARGKSQERAAAGKDLQKIESTRDGYYKSILREEQYTLYLKKKHNLVTSK